MQHELKDLREQLGEIRDMMHRGMSKHEVAFEMVKLINCGRNYPTFEERRTMLMELYRDVFLMISEIEKL